MIIPFGFMAKTSGTPSIPPGASLWLKADAGVLDSSGNPATNGVGVATWKDQSGHGIDATQTNSAYQPIFATNAINGLPAVQGNSSFLTLNLPYTASYTAFIVIQPISYSGAESQILNCGGGVGFTLHDNCQPLIWDGSWIEGNPIEIMSIQQVTYESDFSTGYKYVYQNGIQTASSSSGGQLGGPSTLFYFSNDGTTRYLNANIAEIIIYPTALSDTDRQAVEGYLNAKYSLYPPDYSNLIRWWNPQVGFDGSSNWVDQASGDVMIGTATVLEPVRAPYTLGTKNLPSIYCASGNGLTTFSTFSTPISVYYAAKPISSPSKRLISGVHNNWLLGWWNGNQDSFYFDGQDGWLNRGNTSTNQPRIYGMSSDGSTAHCYGEGSEIFTGTDGLTAPNGISIGTGGLYDEWTECQVGDILIFKVAHDLPTAQSVMNWLNNKYGTY